MGKGVKPLYNESNGASRKYWGAALGHSIGGPGLAASYPAHSFTTTLLSGSASCYLDSALHQWPTVNFLVRLRSWVGPRESAVLAKLLTAQNLLKISLRCDFHAESDNFVFVYRSAQHLRQ